MIQLLQQNFAKDNNSAIGAWAYSVVIWWWQGLKMQQNSFPSNFHLNCSWKVFSKMVPSSLIHIYLSSVFREHSRCHIYKNMHWVLNLPHAQPNIPFKLGEYHAYWWPGIVAWYWLEDNWLINVLYLPPLTVDLNHFHWFWFNYKE